MHECTAVKLANLTPKGKAQYLGTMIEDDDRMVSRQCKNGGTRTLYREGLAFRVCGQHDTPNACTIRSKGEQVMTHAVVGETLINLATGEETEQQTLPLMEEEENVFVRPGYQQQLFLHAIKAAGFRKGEDGVKRFWYVKKQGITIHTDAELLDAIRAHFDRVASTKYVVVTKIGKVFCFKRDMTYAEMTNCVVKRSRYV